MRILAVEDGIEAAELLLKGLRESGHDPDLASDGQVGLNMAEENDYGVLIVDCMLPVMDGLAMVSELRARDNHTPVLFLSALGKVDDRVRGLKAGGDDYLVKPYAFSELLARLEALNRRNAVSQPDVHLTVGDLQMALLTREVSRAGQPIDLQPREFKLLEYLMRHAGQTVTRLMLLEFVWGYHFDTQTNVIDVHISRLRAKIDKGFEHSMLKTVRGRGYGLIVPD